MSQVYTLQYVASLVGATIHVPNNLNVTDISQQVVNGLAPLATAQPNQIAFLSNPKYSNQLFTTQALAVLIEPDLAQKYDGVALLTADPYAAFARLTHVFDSAPKRQPFIHTTAQIAKTALIAESCYIGPYAVIEDYAQIGAHTVLEAQSMVGAYAQIGEHCFIDSQAFIAHHCVLGHRVRIHSGARIGSEGFGFAPHQGFWHRIAQIGRVVIGDDSRIGSNTTIDRGALDDTVLGKNVIIDNLVQIAHNVKIGDHTAIAANSGIAGSTTIGKHCILAGAVGVVGHIDICDNVQLTGMAMVTKSINQPGSYSSGTGFFSSNDWKKMAVGLRQLPDVNLKRLQNKVNQLEQQIQQLQQQLQPPQ